jgi:hypothetical protein
VSYSDDAIVAVKRIRKGKGLERMTKSMGNKVTIEIAEGMNGPEKPLQAAMFASECGYNARTHTPVLPHLKDYKKEPNLIKDYIGKVAVS